MDQPSSQREAARVVPETRQLRRPSVARRLLGAVLTLLVVPGIGHPLIGRWRRGLGWFAATIAGMGVWLYVPVTAISRVALVALLAIRLIAPVDVFASGRAVAAVPRPRNALVLSLALLAAWFALTGVTRLFVVEAFKAPSGSMLPTLAAGDHVLVEKLVYGLSAPGRGDVVVFPIPGDPKQRPFFKRIVALGGDSVEVRCGVLHLNGKAVAQELAADSSACTYWDTDGDGWAQKTCSRYRETLDGRPYELMFRATRPEYQQRGDRTKMHLASGDFPGPEGSGFPDAHGRGLPDVGERPPPAATAVPGRFERSVTGHADVCAPRMHYVVPDGHVFVMGDNRDDSFDSRRWGPVPVDSILGRVEFIWWSSGPDEEGIRWSRIGTRVQ